MVSGRGSSVEISQTIRLVSQKRLTSEALLPHQGGTGLSGHF